MTTPEQEALVAENIAFLQRVQSAGQIACITLARNPDTGTWYNYQGTILSIDPAPPEPTVEVFVEGAFISYDSGNDQEQIDLFNRLREEREAANPSPDEASTLSADLILSQLLDPEGEHDLKTEPLEDDMGTVKSLRISEIGLIIGLDPPDESDFEDDDDDGTDFEL